MAKKANNTQNLKPFKKGADIRRNLKGAPKKTYTQHIDEIKKKGYTAPTKTEYFDMVSLLLAMTEADLLEYAKNIERPYWIRLIITDLNNKITRQKLMADTRDWLFGSSKQSMDVNVIQEQPLFPEKDE